MGSEQVSYKTCICIHKYVCKNIYVHIHTYVNAIYLNATYVCQRMLHIWTYDNLSADQPTHSKSHAASIYVCLYHINTYIHIFTSYQLGHLYELWKIYKFFATVHYVLAVYLLIFGPYAVHPLTPGPHVAPSRSFLLRFYE